MMRSYSREPQIEEGVSSIVLQNRCGSRLTQMNRCRLLENISEGHEVNLPDARDHPLAFGAQPIPETRLTLVETELGGDFTVSISVSRRETR